MRAAKLYRVSFRKEGGVVTGGYGDDFPMPEDLARALGEREEAMQAFREFPVDQALDLAEWVQATQDPRHREQRVQMVVELVVDHFAKLRKLDLRETHSNAGREEDL